MLLFVPTPGFQSERHLSHRRGAHERSHTVRIEKVFGILQLLHRQTFGRQMDSGGQLFYSRNFMQSFRHSHFLYRTDYSASGHSVNANVRKNRHNLASRRSAWRGSGKHIRVSAPENVFLHLAHGVPGQFGQDEDLFRHLETGNPGLEGAYDAGGVQRGA